MTPLKQNKYRETMDGITTPPALKEKTRLMLLAQTTKRKPTRTIRTFGALAAVLVLLVGLSIWMGTGQDQIAADLHFIALTAEDIETSIRLAPAYPLRRNLPLEDHPGVLPAEPPDGFSLSEGELTAFFRDPTGEPSSVLGRAVYLGQDSGLLTLLFANNTALLFIPVEIGDSQIMGIPAGLGFHEAEGMYYGAYQRDGYTFLLTAEGMDQQEFIRLLYFFVSN